MKNKLFSLFLITISFSLFAQENALIKETDKMVDKSKKSATADMLTDSSYWSTKMLFGINGSQSTFVNWAAGGRNNISLLGFVDGSATYIKKNIKWNSDLKLALGGIRFLGSTPDGSSNVQKTDDVIDLSTALGYEFKTKWYYTAVGGFKTQMLNGYIYPNDSIRTSTFMAPGYVSGAIGIEYAPSKNFNMFISPLASKFTIVNDGTLANKGAYGVKAATYDGTGALLTAGEKYRSEFGAYFRLRFSKELVKNVEMKSRLELFSNYVENPENVDVNAEVIFTFKVNKWLSSSLQWNFVYDDDISVTDSKGRVGARAQFKSVLGLGVSFTLKNKNEK
jgi:hypothetical protein